MPTIVSIAVTCILVRLVMRLATWPQRIQGAMAAALLLWAVAYVLFVADGFGVWEWIMD